jgi:hypothetical protein
MELIEVGGPMWRVRVLSAYGSHVLRYTGAQVIRRRENGYISRQRCLLCRLITSTLMPLFD